MHSFGCVAMLAAGLLSAAPTVQAKKPPLPPLYVVVRKLPPEVFFQRMQLYCLQNGLGVEQVAATQLTCSKPMDDSFRSMMFRALATPNYSTRPVFYLQVSAVRMGDNTTLSIREYMKYQNAFGQETNEPITNRKELESLGKGLQELKANWESRLAANNDDELATVQSANASLAQAGGVLANLPTTAPAPTAPSPSAAPQVNALDHPSSSAAMQALAQLQCTESFRLVGESGGKALFEAKCKGGTTQLVQCSGMSCKALQ